MIKTLNLNKTWDLKGYWSLLNSDGKLESIAGILVLSPDDIRLTLFRSNGPNLDIGAAEYNLDTIKGQLLSGEKVTLVDAIWANSSDILAIYCIVGEHYESSKDIVFDSFFAYQKDLRNWIMKKTSTTEWQENGFEIKVEYPKKDFDININENFNISNFYNTNYSSSISKDPAFEQKVYINFKSLKTPFELKEVITKYFYTWNILFSIMVGRICNIDYLIGVKDEKNIHIFFRKDHYKNKDILTCLMFLPFYSVKDDLENILKSWFNEEKEKNIYAKELFISGFTETNKLTKESFLNLFQALEGMAELTQLSYYLDEKLFKELKQTIETFLEKKGCNSSTKKNFKKRIANLNKKNSAEDFLQRLISEKVDSQIADKLKIDKDYISKMTKVRHHLSHNKGSNYNSIVSFNEFHNMINKMIIILIYYFLVQNNVPEAIIKERILEHSNWIGNFIRHIERTNE